MSKLRFLTLVGLLAAALTPLYGCGNECAPGTADKDGQCVVAAKGCAEGTKLQGGVCLLADSGCGEGTQFVDGVCVPAAESCDDNTKFDEAEGECVPNTDVLCGEGTKVGDDGWCVPAPEACSDVARFDESTGRCIIDAAACGEGTELAADTNECILAEEGCGTGLALDGDTGTCVPTADVCDTGTAFDADSGLCLNDACNLGDVLVNGVCMTPAEDLAQNPDLMAGEPDDPALGGTVNTLTTPFAGDPAYVFTGEIGEPSDIDGDGTVDQDIDVYEFEAEAGGWYQIMVQTTGLEAPAFFVEGPNDYVRYSPLGHGQDAARTIVAPEQGTYRVTVLPALVLQSDGEVSHIGSADATYVGSLKTLDAPTPTAADISGGSAQLTGDFTTLSDNLFEITGLNPGDVVKLDVSVEGDVDGVIQSWTDAVTLGSTTSISDGGGLQVTTTGTSALLLVDWVSLRGASASFDISASLSGGQKTITIPPGGSEELKVTAQVGDTLLVSQSNPNGDTLELTITDVLGDELVSATLLASDTNYTVPVEIAGEHTVTFKNTTTGNVDATLNAKVQVPITFGTLAVGAPQSTPPLAVVADSSEQYAFDFTLPAGSVMRFGHTNDDDNDIRYEIVDSSGAVLQDEAYNWYDLSGTDPEDYDYFYSETGGDFTFKVIGDSSGDANNLVLTLENVGQVMDLGDVDDGSSVSDSVASPVSQGEFRFYRVNTLNSGNLFLEAMTPGGEDIDMYIFEGDFEDFPSSSTSPYDEQYVYDADAEPHFIMLHAFAALPSYEFSATLNPPAPASADFTSAPALFVPNDATPVTDTLTASGCIAIDSVAVWMDITHQDGDEVWFTLTSPNGTVVDLGTVENGGGNQTGWFPQTFGTAGNLTVFENERGDGDWTLTAWDRYDYNNETGTINEWGLALTCK